MKKLMALMVASMFVFTLFACGGDDNGTAQIELSYADWGDAELNQILIDAFMEEYPHIKVTLREDITGTGAAFTANLLNAMAGGVLPDVFAIDNVPTGYTNGMLLDITDMWDADPDTAYVYPNILDTAIYNGRRYAMPSFQFIKGIYINRTVFNDYNIPVPPKDWDYDQFVDVAIQIRQAGQNDMVYAIDPWFGDLDFETIWPGLDDADVGYNTWDGERFHFTSPAWIDAYNRKLELWQMGVPASHTPEELELIGGPTVWPWFTGHTAMSIDGSWMLWQIDSMFESEGFDVGFWPYPGGAAGQFPPTILDFQVISSQTLYPEEAYLLAKWMTFGREGWMTRLDVMEQRGDIYLDRYPVADYPEVWAKASQFIDNVEGLRESIELLDRSKPDLDKWLLGYKAFWEWVEDNEYWQRIESGEITPEVFASEWEEKINELVGAQ